MTAFVLLAFDERTGFVVQAFFQERIFHRHERSAFEVTEEEEQEEAEEADHDTDLFQAGDGEAQTETIGLGSRSVRVTVGIAAVSSFGAVVGSRSGRM